MWLYVIIMSRTHFRVNLHSVAAWMSRTPCSKQARYLKFKWLQRDSNPQPQPQPSVWLDGWVFVYELIGCGFESRCSHLGQVCSLDECILDSIAKFDSAIQFSPSKCKVSKVFLIFFIYLEGFVKLFGSVTVVNWFNKSKFPYLFELLIFSGIKLSNLGSRILNRFWYVPNQKHHFFTNYK